MPHVAHGFQYHPGRESAANTTDFLRELAESHSDTRVGATMHVPRQQRNYWERAAEDWAGSVDFLLADLECSRMSRAYVDRGRGRADFSYLGESNPAANGRRFVKAALDAQRDVGSSVLMSPWLLHGVSQTGHELAATIRFANIAGSEVADDEDLIMGIEVTEGVLASDEARNEFINELVEGPELPVYLRMRITAPPGYMQYRGTDALAGLQEVVTSLAANDRPVALPQSGLSGWLMTAFGARSFGAGFAASLQRNTPPTSGGGGIPPLHWFFVPELLGFVLAEEMEEVSELDGFELCACPYCDGELPGEGTAFDPTDAGKHFVWWCAEFASELDPASPEDTVKERVNEAVTFAEGIEDINLDDRSQPNHLEVWSELLA